MQRLPKVWPHTILTRACASEITWFSKSVVANRPNRSMCKCHYTVFQKCGHKLSEREHVHVWRNTISYLLRKWVKSKHGWFGCQRAFFSNIVVDCDRWCAVLSQLCFDIFVPAQLFGDYQQDFCNGVQLSVYPGCDAKKRWIESISRWATKYVCRCCILSGLCIVVEA